MDEIKREKSCGCVIIDNDKVLILQQNRGHWGFPKGHVEEGETEIETAIRETKEEINLDVEIDEKQRYTTEYMTDKGSLKQVVLFVARKIGGQEMCQECEIKNIKWVSYDEAMETITYDNIREILKNIWDKKFERDK